MSRWCVVVAVLSGCYSPATERPCKVRCAGGSAAPCPGDQECMSDFLCHAPGDPTCPPPEIDAPLADVALIDLPATGPPYCFGSDRGLLKFCSDAVANEPQNFSTTIDTGIAANCNDRPLSGGIELCVIYASTITITGTVRVVGSRPLVLVAVQTIDVVGHLDAGSRRLGGSGAGAGSGACPPATPPTGMGGGAGGTFRGQGGSGGAASGGSQGTAPMPFPPISVRGGCAGATSLGLGGTPGRGGGALYLIAGSAISVGSQGRIDVSGAGAMPSDAGGHGGGSGGLLALDAAGFQIQGELMANGGGGASGSDGAIAQAGDESSAPAVPGAGGGSGAGLNGGNGSAGQVSLVGMAGSGAGATLGAGGGGGGAGWILYFGGVLAASPKISPPPTTLN